MVLEGCCLLPVGGVRAKTRHSTRGATRIPRPRLRSLPIAVSNSRGGRRSEYTAGTPVLLSRWEESEGSQLSEDDDTSGREAAIGP